MLNRSVYQMDPSHRKLVNEGVANVNDGTTDVARQVLRYELETFVCDGQYGKGMDHMLRTYLDNLSRAAAGSLGQRFLWLRQVAPGQDDARAVGGYGV